MVSTVREWSANGQQLVTKLWGTHKIHTSSTAAKGAWLGNHILEISI
jgi:hypothetical protein